MVQIGKPDNIDNYYLTGSKIAKILSLRLGVMPDYRDGADFYFKKRPALESLRKGERFIIERINKASFIE